MENPQTRALSFTSLAHFVNDGNYFLFPVLIPYYEKIPQSSLIGLGSVAIIYNLINGFLSTPVGRLADRIDRDSLLIFTGLFLNAVSVVLFALPFIYHDFLYEFVLIGAIILGIGQSIYHPVGGSILSFVNSREKASSSMGINQAFGSLGRAVTPYMISAVIALIGEFSGLGIFAIYMFLASAVTFAGLHFFSRRNFRRSESSKEKIEDVKPFSHYAFFVYLLTASVFIRSMFMLGVNTYIPTFMTDIYHSETVMSYVLSSGLVVSVAGGPLFGKITSLKGGKFTILLTSGLSLVFFLAFLLTTNIIYTGIAYAVFALSAFTGFPVLLGYVNFVVPREYSTTSNALVWGLGSTVGGAAGIGAIVLLLIYLPLRLSLWTMLIFGALSFILMIFLPSKEKVGKF